MSKGIIVSAPIKRVNQIPDEVLKDNPMLCLTLTVADTLPIDPIDLRQYVLYWDFIEVAYIRNQDFVRKGEPSEEMKYLMQAGVLREVEHIATTGEWMRPESFHLAASFLSMSNTKRQDQHNWALGQSGEGLRFSPLQKPSYKPGFGIDLFHALPVFGADVSVDEVYKFKTARNNELQRFRIAMDKMILSVATANQLDLAIRELQQSIIDLNKTAQEISKSKIKRTVSAFCSSVAFPTSLAVATSLAGFPQAGIPIGLGLGAITLWAKDLPSIFKYSPTESSAFAYLFHAQNILAAGAAWKK